MTKHSKILYVMGPGTRGPTSIGKNLQVLVVQETWPTEEALLRRNILPLRAMPELPTKATKHISISIPDWG